MNMDYCIKSNNKKWNNIMKCYMDEIILCFTEEETEFCKYELKSIYFKYDTYKNPNEIDLFSLLHEIGHCKTSNSSMPICTMEYLATQWALDNAKKFKVKIIDNRIKQYQNYIYDCRNKDIKNNNENKNIPTLDELKLKY